MTNFEIEQKQAQLKNLMSEIKQLNKEYKTFIVCLLIWVAVSLLFIAISIAIIIIDINITLLMISISIAVITFNLYLGCKKSAKACDNEIKSKALLFNELHMQLYIDALQPTIEELQQFIGKNKNNFK